MAGTLDILAETRKELEEWDSGIIVVSDVASSLLSLQGLLDEGIAGCSGRPGCEPWCGSVGQRGMGVL